MQLGIGLKIWHELFSIVLYTAYRETYILLQDEWRNGEEVKNKIYTVGCLERFYQFFTENMWTMAYFGFGLLISELMIMSLAKKLETQILMQMHS